MFEQIKNSIIFLWIIDNTFQVIFGLILTFILGKVAFKFRVVKMFYRKLSPINFKFIKKSANILFIDNLVFMHPNILADQYGWTNCKLVKDVALDEDPNVEKAHMIFVDVHGVARKAFPTDHGLGLAENLKKKNMDKVVVIYSSNPEGDYLHSAHAVIDDRIDKTSDPVVFNEIIERHMKALYLRGQI